MSTDLEFHEFLLPRTYLTLTSALYPEGLSHVRKIKLIIVSKDYCKNAFEDVDKVKEREAVVFMTAARKFRFEKREWGELFISAGIDKSGEDAGCTINIGAFVNYPLSVNGLVDLVRTVTEAKSGALRHLNLTGTVSDAVAVGALPGKEFFAGPGTPLGKSVAKDVRNMLRELL
ncbi:adenosylcobinamide amidohydrolase [Stygiolobus sp. RP850M]|uniref:adenosylcobinamide amidohydrolase n=1 Tax=Stygiolobus sp. RP850M TaxID=3133137 RepID=UPI00307EB953